MSARGSRIRRIGRLRSEASPSNTAVIGQPATAPMTSRQPVPELPKSSGFWAWPKPPTPTPLTFHAKSPVRSTLAPKARIDWAVLSTSSPSSRPEIRVWPTASAPRISARCEIDLSPGTLTLPARGPLERASSGAFCAVGRSEWVKIVSSQRAAGITWTARRHAAVFIPQAAIDSGVSTSQVKHRFSKNPQDHTVAKADLGTKRICPTTGKKFYDLNKNPVISPYTGEVVPIAPVPPPRTRADAAARASAAAAASAAEATPAPAEAEELVPLEEADAEENTGKVTAGG